MTGGFYERFDRIGFRFFLVLIGAVRAQRVELEYTRVKAGATLIGFSLGFVAGLLVFIAPPPAMGSRSVDASLRWAAIGAVAGGMLFLILAAILVYYIKTLRNEDVRVEPNPGPDTSFDTMLNERRKKYLESGYPQKDADREAKWFAKLMSARLRGRW